jgi:hypothetical protein
MSSKTVRMLRREKTKEEEIPSEEELPQQDKNTFGDDVKYLRIKELGREGIGRTIPVER